MSAKDIKEEFFHDKSWNKSLRDGLTFVGVVYDDDVFVKIANERKWKDSTTEKYLSDLETYVFPYVRDISIRKVTKEKCEDIIKSVIKKRREKKLQISADENMQRHIGFLLSIIFEKAAEQNFCENVLWGSRYSIYDGSEKSKQTNAREELVVLPKSLTIKEEIAVSNRIMKNPEQDGENMALALMFCLGIRENEACGLNFEDIKKFNCDEKRYYMQISKSSVNRSSRKVKFGGKTMNAVRLVPIPSKLLELLKKRKEYVRRCLAGKGEHRERYPIACKNNNFNERLTPNEVGRAGTKLFQEVSEDIRDNNHGLENKVAFIDSYLSSNDEKYDIDKYMVEKNPTAYLFRRNVATHLSILGLDQNEIEYIMGHNIEDETDSRNFFKNEDKLYPIALKMAQRPIVNEDINTEQVGWDDESGILMKQNINHICMNIPVSKKDHVYVQIRQREPSKMLNVSVGVSNDSVRLNGRYRAFPVNDQSPDTMNVISYYKEHYNKEINDISKND